MPTATLAPQPDAFSKRCPSRSVLERIGEKWSVLVLLAIEGGATRPGELRRRVEGISKKIATETLRRLERDGLVERAAFAERVPRVEYALTPTARELVPVLLEIKRWAERHCRARLAKPAASAARSR